MLVLIGADGKDLDSAVSKRFGHAPFFIVYDSGNNVYKTYDNIDENDDHRNLLEFLEMGVTAFIVGNIGPHAFEKIHSEKVGVYLARKMLAKEAIEQLIAGKLQRLTEPTAKKSIGHNSGNGNHHHHHDDEDDDHNHNAKSCD